MNKILFNKLNGDIIKIIGKYNLSKFNKDNKFLTLYELISTTWRIFASLDYYEIHNKSKIVKTKNEYNEIKWIIKN